MLVPNHFVFTLKFHSNFSPKRKLFFWKKKSSPPQKKILPFFYATFQLGRYGVFKKKLKKFLIPKKWKNRPQKLLIIGPDPLISQSSPDQQPTARIDFSYYEISGPGICFLICALNFHNFIHSEKKILWKLLLHIGI